MKPSKWERYWPPSWHRVSSAERRPRTRPRPSKKAATKPAAAPSRGPSGAVTPPTVPQRRRWVSPAARRLAQSLAVDIDTVSGTGPQGAVTISDVEHAGAAKQAAAKPATKPLSKPTPADRAAQMRKSIAAAMGRSKREIPHYYLADEIILENALTWLTARNAQRSIDERVLPAALLLKAVGIAAQRFGEFNGFWRDDGFQPASGVHVGVGISLRGGGLVAPAIHDVPEKKLDELMDDLTDLVARARSFSLRSSEMSDPTITVTNLGDKGVDAVFGIIYPPQVALVGFGQPSTAGPRDRRRNSDRHHRASHACRRPPGKRRPPGRFIPQRDQRAAPAARPPRKVMCDDRRRHSQRGLVCADNHCS